MFVVFEGIDGSGKTTVSNLVAKALRARGIEVDHVREGGEFASPLVSRMREFGKDTLNLALRPLPEFLLYVARDAQLLAECVRPTLAKGGLVFADRYLYSYEVLGHYGRGLELEPVRSIIDAAAEGLWPDLVVLMDVDPHWARARRRSAKIQKKAGNEETSGGSRKGLGGVGMMHRLRDGYLKIAEREETRWLVIDNANAALSEVVDRVTEAIASLYEGADSKTVVEKTSVETSEVCRAKKPTVEAAYDAFFEMVDARGQREAAVGAYFLSGLVGQRAHRKRKAFAEEVPHVVAYGLKGLTSADDWELREILVDKSPALVARSIAGPAAEDSKANSMRRTLIETSPLAVLSSLGGNDCDLSWQLRKTLWDPFPLQVVSSLKRLDSERAWELRDRLQGGQKTSDLGWKMRSEQALVASVKGLGGARAWAIRDGAMQEWPAQVLRSISGVLDDKAWRLRDEYADLAPKIVLRSFDSDESERAWAMRKRFASRVKEAIDSMQASDSSEAWAIRDALAEVWPSTIANSLGALASGDRGQSLLVRLLELAPANPSLLKHAAQVYCIQATGGAARWKAAQDA